MRRPSIPTELKDRKDDLSRALRRLSGQTVEIVKLSVGRLEDGLPYAEIRHQARVKRCGFLFHVREVFHHIEVSPELITFKYSLTREEDIGLESPLFRYECHPFDKDPSTSEIQFRNNYSELPHFHPDKTLDFPIVQQLHYPFGRTERRAIVFALINWISIDLVRRNFPGAG